MVGQGVGDESGQMSDSSWPHLSLLFALAAGLATAQWDRSVNFTATTENVARRAPIPFVSICSGGPPMPSVTN